MPIEFQGHSLVIMVMKTFNDLMNPIVDDSCIFLALVTRKESSIEEVIMIGNF